MQKPKKKLLLRAKNLITQARTAEELYSFTLILKMYMSNPEQKYEEALKTYCDVLESSIEIDKQEEKRLVK